MATSQRPAKHRWRARARQRHSLAVRPTTMVPPQFARLRLTDMYRHVQTDTLCWPCQQLSLLCPTNTTLSHVQSKPLNCTQKQNMLFLPMYLLLDAGKRAGIISGCTGCGSRSARCDWACVAGSMQGLHALRALSACCMPACPHPFKSSLKINELKRKMNIWIWFLSTQASKCQGARRAYGEHMHAAVAACARCP